MQQPLKSAQDYAAVRDWPGYFQAVLGKPPRETLLKALELFEKEGVSPGFAIDLGCGEGRDTLELLRRGWRVLAIDEHPEAFRHLLAQVPPESASRLEVMERGFDGLTLPSADLVNASFSLPFCPPRHFEGLWGQVVGSIRPGGRFAGQFFGDRDSWSVLPDRTHHSRAEVESLLEHFEVEQLQEEERDSGTAIGLAKHWHVFHVVGRRG